MMFTYGVRFRPPSSFTLPRPRQAVAGTHDDFPHGTVSYSTPLWPEEVAAFQLAYLPTEVEVAMLAADLADRLRGEEFDETDTLRIVIGQEIERRGWHLHRGAVVDAVAGELSAGPLWRRKGERWT